MFNQYIYIVSKYMIKIKKDKIYFIKKFEESVTILFGYFSTRFCCYHAQKNI